MRRYWVERCLDGEENFVVEGSLFKHIVKVCRQKEGDQFELTTPEGSAYLAEVVSLNQNQALVRLLKKRELPQLKRPYIHLCLCLPKFSKFEVILEKSAELGIFSVHPFFRIIVLQKTSKGFHLLNGHVGIKSLFLPLSNQDEVIK